MIYLLIMILIRRSFKNNPNERFSLLIDQLSGYLFRLALVCLILVGASVILKGQELNYHILKGGERIGNMQLTRANTDSSVSIRLQSSSSARVLVQIRVNTWEESHFRNGYLIYYKGLREVNGRKKMNRQIRWRGAGYLVTDGSEQSLLDSHAITDNILMLYFEEPVNKHKVFSESLKRWVEIRKTGPNRYQLLLDDGNYNEYFYENTTCSKVKVHTSLFNATFLRIN